MEIQFETPLILNDQFNGTTFSQDKPTLAHLQAVTRLADDAKTRGNQGSGHFLGSETKIANESQFKQMFF